MSFICFKMVDFPDSPAPEMVYQYDWPNHHADDELTQKQHLDLIALHHLVTLELVLNLLIARLPLLILGTHSATHCE